MKKFVIESVKFISMITAGFLAVIIFAGVIIFGLNGFVSDLPQLETQISTPIPNPYHFALFHFMRGFENGIGHLLLMLAPLGYFLFVFIFGGLIFHKGLKIAGKTPAYIDWIMTKYNPKKESMPFGGSIEKTTNPK